MKFLESLTLTEEPLKLKQWKLVTSALDHNLEENDLLILKDIAAKSMDIKASDETFAQ